MNQKTLNIIMIGLFIYLIYQIRCIKKEQFSYQEPTQAIKNLGELAKKLTTGGLTIPGNVNIKGKLVVEHPQTSNTNDFALEVAGRSSLSNNSIQFVKDEKQGGTILLAGNTWKVIQPNGNYIDFGSAGLSCNELSVTGSSYFANGAAQIKEGKDKKYPYGLIFLLGPNSWTSINPNENNNLSFSPGVEVNSLKASESISSGGLISAKNLSVDNNLNVKGNITSAGQNVLKNGDSVYLGNNYGNLTQGGCGGSNPQRYACQYNRYALDIIKDDKTSFKITKR